MYMHMHMDMDMDMSRIHNPRERGSQTRPHRFPFWEPLAKAIRILSPKDDVWTLSDLLLARSLSGRAQAMWQPIVNLAQASWESSNHGRVDEQKRHRPPTAAVRKTLSRKSEISPTRVF